MKLKTYPIALFIILTLLTGALFAQETKENKIVLPYGNSLTRDTIPDLSFQPDSTLQKKRKKNYTVLF